jgi:hypothetical protein
MHDFTIAHGEQNGMSFKLKAKMHDLRQAHDHF